MDRYVDNFLIEFDINAGIRAKLDIPIDEKFCDALGPTFRNPIKIIRDQQFLYDCIDIQKKWRAPKHNVQAKNQAFGTLGTYMIRDLAEVFRKRFIFWRFTLHNILTTTETDGTENSF